jgi:hypothetical protein
VAGCAGGGRTHVRARDCRHPAWLRVPDTSRPDGRSFRKQRTVNPPIIPILGSLREQGIGQGHHGPQ